MNKRVIKVIYAVNDKKANNLDGFMMFRNDAEALRAFVSTCEKEEIIKKWAEDYQFLKLGEIYEDGSLKEDKHVAAEAINYVQNEKSTKENK